MSNKRILFRRLAAFLVLTVFVLPLAACQNQVVEKVGVLPDRTTQLTAHTTDEEEEVQGKSWAVQNIDHLTLSSADMIISDTPSTHYYGDTAYLTRTTAPSETELTYSFEEVHSDGTLTVLYSITLPADASCCFAPDGSSFVYETWIDGCLTLMMKDLNSLDERIVWQSEEAATFLADLKLQAHLICQWSPDGSSLLFLPICYADETTESIDIEISEDEVNANDDASQVVDAADNAEEKQAAAAAEKNDQEESAEKSMETDAAPALSELSPAEKMHLVYETLPGFPLIYTYQRESSSLESFLIAEDDYALYEAETAPLICAGDSGSQFFIYFNSPWNTALAHYVDVNELIHYSTPLTDYLPSFTTLGSDPVFYDSLLYLHVDGIGIMVLDPAQGNLIQLYSFNDPIDSFAIYENTLIVAQPASAGVGVDVTAYLLNLETKQSVLLYHSETADPYINYMEMSDDGMYLLLEQISSGYRSQKQLIQLSFQ